MVRRWQKGDQKVVKGGKKVVKKWSKGGKKKVAKGGNEMVNRWTKGGQKVAPGWSKGGQWGKEWGVVKEVNKREGEMVES